MTNYDVLSTDKMSCRKVLNCQDSYTKTRPKSSFALVQEASLERPRF